MKRREHAIVLGVFTLLALVLSWPLPLRIFGWVPGAPQWAFDESTFVWNIWQLKHALIDNLASPLHSDLIYYPLGIDLILYTFNFFNALVAQPLHLAVGLVFSSNITVLLSTVLSGYGAYLLVKWQLAVGRRQAAGAALLAGLIYAFASNRAIYMTLGHYDMVTTQWIPFYALALLRSLDPALSPARRRKAAVLAGVFFAFAGLAEMIVAVFLAIFTVIVVLCRWQVAGGRWQAAVRSQPTNQPTNQPIPNTQYPIPNHPISQSPNRPIFNLQSSIFLSLFLSAAVAFLLWSPVLIPILRQFLTEDFSLKGWGEAIPLSTDLLGWFTPTVLHPLFGGDLVAELRRVQLRALEGGVTGFRDINTVFIGWVTGALALVGWLAYRARVRIWAWTTLIFGLFTLGPFLQINGQYRFNLDGVETSFPLPYALLHYIPIIKANRAPNRNSVLLMLGVAVLAAYGVYWILDIGYPRLRRRLTLHSPISNTQSPISNTQYPIFNLQSPIFLSLLLSVAVLFEHLAVPLPLSDHRVPSVYAQIAQDPAPVSVMHAPLGWRNSFGVYGVERTLLQYYQSVHGKPMLGGNISRAPDFKMDYFKRIPLFQAIRDVEFNGAVDPGLAEQAAAQAGELMYLYNVGYVLLAPPIPQRFPYADTWQATWDFYKRTLPLEAEPFWRGDGMEAYRVVQPPDQDAFQISLGQPGTFPYRAEGWDGAETDAPYGEPAIWATGRESCVFLPLRGVDSTGTYSLRVRAHPFAYPGGPQQTVTATVNGQGLPSQSLAPEWQTLAWEVPGAALRDTINRICFTWGYAASPRQVTPGSRQIGSTGVNAPVDLELKAFAEGAWMTAFDEEGAPQDISAGRRGVNVTVLDPETGEMLAREGFDTAANAFESEKLAAFLDQVPAGAIVLAATRGEAWTHLDEKVIAGLQSVGADVSLEALQGRYLAVVGVKGASPGSASMALAEGEAFLAISLNRDRRTLAAAVGTIAILPR